LAHRHLAECKQQGPLPLDRQGLPNWAGRSFDHRAIQASAPRRTTPGSQAAAGCRVASTYQRCLVWGIENAFCRLKDFRRVATRYDKLAANFLSGVALATALAFWL